MPDDPVEAVAFALITLVITELALSYATAIGVAIENDADDLALSPSDLERLANLARSLIQAAILLHRHLYGIEEALPIIEGLRTTAALIQLALDSWCYSVHHCCPGQSRRRQTCACWPIAGTATAAGQAS